MATEKNCIKKVYNIYFCLLLIFNYIALLNPEEIFSQNPDQKNNSRWFWSQPIPTGNLLYSVHFTDQLTGYAVGEFGNIIKTTNGGNDWMLQSSNTSFDLLEVFFINDLYGFAVGKSGTIIKTNDGGKNWITNPSGMDNYLHDITFINKFTGYIAGLNGIILKSSNSGNNWIKLKTLSNAPLFCLSFLNEKEGVAGGYNVILKTSNGGKSWSNQNINFLPPCAVVGISYIDNKTIFAAGNSPSGSFYKTTNNGLNWVSSSLNLPYLFDGSVDLVRSMSFININTGFIVTDFGTILNTTNGGDNWLRDSVFRPSYNKFSTMYDINIKGSNFINIAGSGGTIINSTDTGLSWIPKTGNKKTLKGSNFINSKTGFTVGEKGNILKSENEGRSWFNQNTFTNKFLNSIFFINNNTGFTAGDSGAIYKTTNCGVNWINQTNYVRYDINCIYFMNDEDGVAAGGNPDNERAFIFKTDNGGTNWYEVFDSLSLGVLNSVNFMNETIGITAADNGNILQTFDGGESWSASNISSENLTSVSFSNSQNGLIAGTNGLVYKTTNAGINWLTIISGVYLKLSTIKFYDNDFAIAAGDNGAILITNNGGYNWILQQKITNNNLNSVNIINGNRLFAFGEYGTIIYSDINKSILSASENKTKDDGSLILSQNFPNPFNPVTIITYSLPNIKGKVTSVKLIVYNIQGKEIQTLVNKKQESGNYSVKFDASNNSSGIYFYSLYLNEKSIDTRRMVVLK